MRRVLYWKRLLIVLAAGLVLGGAVFAVHRVQVRSQASVLKEQAERVLGEAKDDPAKRGEAATVMRQYLKFRPDDEDAFQKYAAMLFDLAAAEPASAERAAQGIEDFLRAFPDHPDERRKLARLYIDTHHYNKLALARQHLLMLAEGRPADAATRVDVLEMLATCEEGLGGKDNVASAVNRLDDAIKTGQAPVRVFQRVMELRYRQSTNPTADIAPYLEKLRGGGGYERFANDLEARVAAFRFATFMGVLNDPEDGSPKDSNRELDHIFNALGGRNSPDALLARAEWHLAHIKSAKQAAESLTKAEKDLRDAFALDNKHVEVGMLLSDVLHRQSRREEAVKTLKATARALDQVNDQLLMVIDQMLDLGEQDFTSQLVEEKLAPDEAMKAMTAYFRGRVAVLKGEWLDGLRLLDEAAPVVSRVGRYHKRLLIAQAACYSAMQNPDKQLEFCRRAMLVDRQTYLLALVGEAEALLHMGKFNESLKKYRNLVELFELEAYRTQLVHLELKEVLVQPPEVRGQNWRAFDAALGDPTKKAGWTPEMYIYYAQSQALRGDPPGAVQTLEDWIAGHPKDPSASAVWVALARTKDGGKVDSAAAVLDQAEKAVGLTAGIRLARAEVLAARARPVTAGEFEALAANRETLSTGDQYKLLLGLGQMAGQVADRGPDGDAAKAMRAAAVKFLQAAAVLSPRDLGCRAALLDQALAAGQMDVVNQVLDEMKGVEGPGGPVRTLGRIAVELPQVQKLTDKQARAEGFKRLREMAAFARDQRPGWSRPYIALAKFDELEELKDSALTNYVAAIDRGERQEIVIRRAVELYREKQQDLKAVGLLEKLRAEVRLPDDLERYRALYQMLANDIPKDSRPTIDRVARADSDDYRVLLLRGSLLAAIRDDDEALKAFRRAVEKADKMPEAWASLVAQLLKVGKADDAKRAIAEAEKKLTPALDTPQSQAETRMALGGLHEMIGDLPAALKYFSAARDAAPLEMNPVRQLVHFFQRTGQKEKALALMNEAKDSPAADVARWARRRLALTMIARPDAYNHRAEALKLIEQNLADGKEDSEDVKVRATIWTVDPETRERGVGVLREYGDRGDLTPDEYYLLGQLAFDEGKLFESLKYFKLAARLRPGVTAGHMAAVVRVYLALNALGEAEAALERLKGYHSASWDAVREEARVLQRKSKSEAALGEPAAAKKLLGQARDLVMKYPGWDKIDTLASRTGPLFEELGLAAEAEAAYKKYLDAEPSPGAHIPLALFYVRQKRTEKAIALAREREAKVSAAVTAQLLTGAVRMQRPAPAEEEKIEAWLAAKLKDAAGNPEAEAPLIGARAQLLDAQKKYDEAIKEYERCIATFNRVPNPTGTNDLAVNNLCMLLALRSPERADEAVKMMSDLIAIRGPVPAYLDTRAVAYLVSTRPAEAKKDLNMALIQYDRGTYHFHLAWALHQDVFDEKPAFVADELRKAKRLGMTEDDLHPIEYERYQDLRRQYKVTE